MFFREIRGEAAEDERLPDLLYKIFRIVFRAPAFGSRITFRGVQILGTRFTYSGDSEARITSWLKEHLSCHSDLPPWWVPGSRFGVDLFRDRHCGLAAAPEIDDATGETFKGWCKKYLLARLQSIDGKPLEAVDLWAARCGVLHTSAPVSTLSRKGKIG